MYQRVLLLVFLTVCNFGTLAETKRGMVTITSELYSQADKESTVTATVREDTEVTILEQSGIWYRVAPDFPAGSEGWIWLNVQPQSNLSWLERFRRVLKGGYSTQESTAVATIGIRGLGPGDIRKAAPDTNELGKLDRYQSDASRARRMAGLVGLRSQPVAYLVNPKSSGTESQGGYSR